MICIYQKILGGSKTLRIYSASIILSLLVLIPPQSIAQETLFSQANCTIVYSLKRSADRYFNDAITQLSEKINIKIIHFIDLNNWGKTSPHIEISGRLRHQLRQQYSLADGVNQAIVFDKKGQILSRYSGSVTLVNALIDCN
jgi:hypothetical protein